MDIVTMLAAMFSIGLSSLALGLCILYSMRTQASWAKLLVAFLSVIVGAMTLIAIEHYTSFSLAVFGMESIAHVLSIVFVSIVNLCVAFLVMFLPFFVSLVLGNPRHEKLFWMLLSVMAVIYLALGILEQFYDNLILLLAQSLIFAGVYLFCLITLWRNVGNVKASDTRRFIVTSNIVSISLLPVFVISFVFSEFLITSYALYSMAFSIVIIVFFYGFFSRDFNEKQRKSRTITIADLNAYHISEREFSVIQLVSQGLTNKEIASELNISVNTVNNHVANIFSKTGVRSRIDLLNLLRELNK